MINLAPWPEPVDGADVLYSIEAVLRRHASMPDGSPELVALWVMFSWAIDASDIAPRLLLTSPMRRCGKTTVLDILTALVHRPEANVNVTAASLYTAIDQDHCTLILDEADQWATKRGPVMSVLNSGHSRATAFVPRVIGGVRVRYSTYAAIAIAALGRPLPATLEDRCIIVRMRRKRPDEVLERFSLRHTEELTELARKCQRWASDNMAALRAADPEIPAGAVRPRRRYRANPARHRRSRPRRVAGTGAAFRHDLLRREQRKRGRDGDHPRHLRGIPGSRC
jgi:hypothetical protein